MRQLKISHKSPRSRVDLSPDRSSAAFSVSPRTARAAFTTRTLAVVLALAAVLLATGTTLWLRQEIAANAEQARSEAEQVVLEAASRSVAAAESTPTPKVGTAARESHAPRPPEADVAAAPPVPDVELEEALGDSGADYDRRRKTLRDHIAGPITPEAEASLEGFVRRTGQPEGLSQAQTDSLKSDALFALRKNDQSSGRATGLMRDLVADPDQGLVMREFVLQHLARHHEDVPESEKPEIEQALWDAAENAEEDEIAATALLGLDGIQESGELESAEAGRLSGLALERLAGEKPQAIVAALHTLAGLKDRAGIEPARALLEGETRHSSTTVRLAAIYLLGQIAPGAEAERLRFLAAEGDPYERRAAKAALESF